MLTILNDWDHQRDLKNGYNCGRMDMNMPKTEASLGLRRGGGNIIVLLLAASCLHELHWLPVLDVFLYLLGLSKLSERVTLYYGVSNWEMKKGKWMRNFHPSDTMINSCTLAFLILDTPHGVEFVRLFKIHSIPSSVLPNAISMIPMTSNLTAR